MTLRPFGRLDLFHPSGESTDGADRSYECTYCERTFQEWPGACSDCGQIVVRVVDPRPVPDH